MFGKCKQCGFSAGLLGIKQGLCKSCRSSDTGAEDAYQKLKSGILNRSENWHLVGSGIADDCYQKGLCSGDIVALSQVSVLIQESYADSCRKIVENGFLQRMNEYIDNGLVQDSEC